MNENLRCGRNFAASFTKNTTHMKRTVLVFGLIAGLIVSVFMGTSMAIMGCHEDPDFGAMSMVIGYTGMLIAFSFVFIGIKSHRDKVLGGVITFGRAFSIGLLIALIASSMYVITWAVEYHVFFPDFMDKYSAQTISDVDTTGKTAAEVEALRADAVQDVADVKEVYASPVGFALVTYAEILPIGVLVSLISAAILRRRRKEVTPL
jgi:MFS family permease